MGKRCTRSNKNILLPPMISHFAKMDAERRAKKKQLTKVKIEIVKGNFSIAEYSLLLIEPIFSEPLSY